MAILNYSTSIDCEKTIAEIQRCLAKKGANKIIIDYTDQLPTSLTFCIEKDNQTIGFSLPANYTGVMNAMKKDGKVTRKLLTKEQALRVSWRILKDWVEAQMALVEAEMADISEVFLPYMITSKGTTVYNEFQNNTKLLLGGR